MRTTSQLLFALIMLLSVDSAAQTSVQSFDQLAGIVSPGMLVVIQTADNRSATGKVVSLTGAAIEIDRQLSFFRIRRVSFPDASVRRIEKRDSLWNGVLIGVGIGVAATAVDCAVNPDPGACLLLGLLAPLGGGALGASIDEGIRLPLYISPSGVQLGPVGGRGRIGVVAAVHF